MISHTRLRLLVLFAVAGALLVEQAQGQTNYTYPLKPSSNNRYLVDQNNVPFMIVGDAEHDLVPKVPISDYHLCLSDRKAQGFNTVDIYVCANQNTAGNANGATYDGVMPFTTTGDLSTPNPLYFSRLDSAIAIAGRLGLNVILCPLDEMGWLSMFKSNGLTKCRTYGQYLGNRIKNYDNIIWQDGNDYAPSQSDDSTVMALVLGIKDMDTRHFHTIELNVGSSSLDDPRWAPVINLDLVYTYSVAYQPVLAEYNRSSLMPVFMYEAHYENDQGASTIYLRSTQYWTILSGGIGGHVYGNSDVNHFTSVWKNHLADTGTIQIQYLPALFANRKWYDLVPDGTHAVVTAGYGTSGGSDYVTAARTADGSLVVAYLPAHTTITVDMTKLSSSSVRAQWFDPTKGTYATISGSPFANTGSHSFTPPNTNATGYADFVLVLETGSTSIESILQHNKPGRTHCWAVGTVMHMAVDRSAGSSPLKNAAVFDTRGRLIATLFPIVNGGRSTNDEFVWNVRGLPPEAYLFKAGAEENIIIPTNVR